MILENLKDLLNYKDTPKRLVGIDYGDKYVGLSLSDTTWSIASPLTLVSMDKKLTAHLNTIANEHKVAVFVIGLPRNMNGSYGPQCDKIKAFSQKFEEQTDIPLFFWDERLSTMAVTRTLLEADVSRKRRKDLVDKMAATYILQGVLDALKRA